MVLVLGATGQLGKLIAERLVKNNKIPVRVTARKTEQLSQLKEKYKDVVYLDLDDPRTFDDAIKDVDSLFLLTGYTVNMLVQSKAIIDAAKKGWRKTYSTSWCVFCRSRLLRPTLCMASNDRSIFKEQWNSLYITTSQLFYAKSHGFLWNC